MSQTCPPPKTRETEHTREGQTGTSLWLTCNMKGQIGRMRPYFPQWPKRFSTKQTSHGIFIPLLMAHSKVGQKVGHNSCLWVLCAFCASLQWWCNSSYKWGWVTVLSYSLSSKVVMILHSAICTKKWWHRRCVKKEKRPQEKPPSQSLREVAVLVRLMVFWKWQILSDTGPRNSSQKR